MAWKEIVVGAVVTVAGGANYLYVSSTAEGAAEVEVQKRLAPLEDKVDRVYDSQLRMEDWFRMHLERHE